MRFRDRVNNSFRGVKNTTGKKGEEKVNLPVLAVYDRVPMIGTLGTLPSRSRMSSRQLEITKLFALPTLRHKCILRLNPMRSPQIQSEVAINSLLAARPNSARESTRVGAIPNENTPAPPWSLPLRLRPDTDARRSKL